ncbi:hypothetical protein HPB50_020144 [Hyalomma asiaticum]|uniref:Uncharacterized protein n=1 Tax=Hyalomma asiaticum TaxID=266040 RepID=A0ACB7RKE7_HYAAI|nr:hypothetical protein HPB50_020144 [Hyalomma asiaticum]
MRYQGFFLSPPTFDRTMSWFVFLRQLESADALCAWPEHHKARILVIQLRSPAADFWSTDYDSLVVAFKSRYGDCHLGHLHLAELQHVRKGKYSLQEPAAHVERLLWKALAGCPLYRRLYRYPSLYTPSMSSTFNLTFASPTHLLSVLP